jgi:hypothetical protein
MTVKAKEDADSVKAKEDADSLSWLFSAIDWLSHHLGGKGDGSKDGADLVRDKVVNTVFCLLERRQHVKPGDAVKAWNLLNLNTIISYWGAVNVLVALAALSLWNNRSMIRYRGQQLRLLLISLAGLLTFGTVQLHAYFDWPFGLLKPEYRKPFSALADASTNFIGLKGSMIILLSMIGPLVWWLKDLDQEQKLNPTRAADIGSDFTTSYVVGIIAAMAAPALTSPFIQLLAKP